MVMLHMHASLNDHFSDKQTKYIIFHWWSEMKEFPVKWELTVWYILIYEYPRPCGPIVHLSNCLQLFYVRIKC